MKKHKGQVIVEFALVLPFFLLLMYGIIYCGILFYDYSTLNNIARASAREAAITKETPVNGRYPLVEAKYQQILKTVKTEFYDFYNDNTDLGPIVIQEEEPNAEGVKEGVSTTLTLRRTVDGFFVDMIMPSTFTIKYYMRKEPNNTTAESPLSQDS